MQLLPAGWELGVSPRRLPTWSSWSGQAQPTLEEEVSQEKSVLERGRLGGREQMPAAGPPGQPVSHTSGAAFLEVETSSQKNFFLIPK